MDRRDFLAASASFVLSPYTSLFEASSFQEDVAYCVQWLYKKSGKGRFANFVQYKTKEVLGRDASVLVGDYKNAYDVSDEYIPPRCLRTFSPVFSYFDDDCCNGWVICNRIKGNYIVGFSFSSVLRDLPSEFEGFREISINDFDDYLKRRCDFSDQDNSYVDYILSTVNKERKILNRLGLKLWAIHSLSDGTVFFSFLRSEPLSKIIRHG